MQSVRFVKYLFFMIDYLRAITTTSEKFQKKQLLIIEVKEIMDNLTGELELLKEEPGENSMKFYASLNREDLQLKNASPIPVQLKGQTPVEYASDNDIQNLLQSTIQYLEDRFKDFKEKPLKSFSVFNFQYWPREEKDLLKFGRTEIRDLLEHFAPLLTEDEKSNIMREWTVLKNRLKKQRTDQLSVVYSELLQAQPDEVKNILPLVNIMVTLSPSTAECERQFSAMNIIKTCLRTNLKQETLEALMRVKSDGPDLSQYNPTAAIHLWMSSGPGTRHLSGHQKPQKH